jgi:hypothetical protein
MLVESYEVAYAKLMDLVNSTNFKLKDTYHYDIRKQKEMLGPFFREGIHLPILPQCNEIAMTYYPFTFAGNDNVTDISKCESNEKIVTMIGVSGVGKTHLLFMRAVRSKSFLIYITGKRIGSIIDSIPEHRQPTDLSYLKYLEIVMLYISQIENIEVKTGTAIFKTKCFILARVLHLKRLLDLYENVTPMQFLLSQINGSSEEICHFVVKCLDHMGNFSPEKIDSILSALLEEIRKITGIPVEIAVDEASIIAQEFPNAFLSPNKKKRGLLTIFGQCLRLSSFDRVFFAGTGLSLSDSEILASSLLMKKEERSFYEFPMNNSIDDVWNDLSRCLDLTGCEALKQNISLMRKIVGRKRLFAVTVRYLSQYPYRNSDNNKKEILETVINQVYEQAKKEIVIRLDAVYEASSSKTFKNQLLKTVERFICAYYLTGGKIETTTQIDFLDMAIAQPVKIKNPNTYYYSINDYLATDACLEFYKKKKEPTQALLSLFVSHLDIAVGLMGKKTTTKGNAFELIVGAQMFQYNGLKWSQLPFLDNEVKEKAKWLSTPMINISKLNTSEALGFRNDQEAIQTIIDGEDGASIFLLCCLEMGPDLLLVTKQNNRIYCMVFALKFYTNTIANNVTDKNLRTSNLGSVYHNKFGEINNRRKEEHKQFHKLFNDELIDLCDPSRTDLEKWEIVQYKSDIEKMNLNGGILRIIIELPNANILHQDYADSFQVVVKFDNSNIHKFITDNDTLNVIRRILCKHMQLVLSYDDTMIDSDAYMDIDNEDT